MLRVTFVSPGVVGHLSLLLSSGLVAVGYPSSESSGEEESLGWFLLRQSEGRVTVGTDFLKTFGVVACCNL